MLSSSVAAGATSLPVNSFTPSVNYAIGTEVVPLSVTLPISTIFPNATKLRVSVVSGGGGGAGGGNGQSGSYTGGGGGGGGGGAVSTSIMSVGSATTMTAVAIGQGGYGGAGTSSIGRGGNNGANGGASSVTLNGVTLGSKVGGNAGTAAPSPQSSVALDTGAGGNSFGLLQNTYFSGPGNGGFVNSQLNSGPTGNFQPGIGLELQGSGGPAGGSCADNLGLGGGAGTLPTATAAGVNGTASASGTANGATTPQYSSFNGANGGAGGAAGISATSAPGGHGQSGYIVIQQVQ